MKWLGPLVSGTKADGSDYSMPVTTAPGRALARGKFYFAGTGKQTLAAAGNVKYLIENPVGSGRTVYIARFAGMSSVAVYADVLINPTTDLPTTARPKTNGLLIGGGSASVANVYTDQGVTAMSGGTNTGTPIGFPANQRLSIDLPPLVLSPGGKLAINIPFSGTGDCSMTVYWWES